MTPDERGEGDPEDVDAGDRWERAGRDAVSQVLDVARDDVNETVWELVDGLYYGEDPSPDQVRRARRDLNALHRAIEELVAPAAGLESWGGQLPDIPYGRGREHWKCERAVSEGDDE